MVINANLGKLIAGHFKPQGSGASFSWTDIAGVNHSSTIYGSNLANKYNRNPNTTSQQVGKGITPATNIDTNIEDPFTNSPEQSRVNATPAGYNSGLGKIQVPALISNTGGSGSISEACLYGFYYSAPSDFVVLLARSNVSPVANFISGQNINIEFEVLI